MSELELYTLLELQNQYSFDRFALRKYQLESLDDLEQRIEQKQERVLNEHQAVQRQAKMTFEEVMADASPTKSKVHDAHNKDSLRQGIEALKANQKANS